MEHTDNVKAGERALILRPDTDAAGRRILGNSSQSSGSEEGVSRYKLKTADTNLVSPLTFTIVDYSYDKIIDPFEVIIPIGGKGVQ